MQISPVTGPGMLNPMWFNTVRHGQHSAEVAADASVTVNGVALRLCRDTLAAGTASRVWLTGHLASHVCRCRVGWAQSGT